MPQPEAPKRAFIESLSPDMPANEAVKVAADQGIEVTAHYVRRVRNRKARAAPKRRRRPPASKDVLDRQRELLRQLGNVTRNTLNERLRQLGLPLAHSNLYAKLRQELGITGRGRKPFEASKEATAIVAPRKRRGEMPSPDAHPGPQTEAERDLLRIAADVGVPRAAALIHKLQSAIAQTVNKLLE